MDGKKKKIIGIVVGCVCLIVAAVLIFGDAFSAGEKSGDSKDEQYLDIVQEGSMYYFPDETVEEAFNDFFVDPEWKTFISEDGERIVEFNGECTYGDEAANCCIQFTVDEDEGEFEITYIDIDGEQFTGSDVNDILEIIFSE